jgi:hypothetical protein
MGRAVRQSNPSAIPKALVPEMNRFGISPYRPRPIVSRCCPYSSPSTNCTHLKIEQLGIRVPGILIFLGRVETIRSYF